MWLLLTVVLFYSAVCLYGNYTTTGPEYSLDCVNDYLYIINCSISIWPEVADTNQTSYWLLFEKSWAPESPHRCVLRKTDTYYSCSLDTADKSDPDDNVGNFYDTTIFRISLYHRTSDGNTSSILLDDNYMPVKNIKPNAPVNLIVNRESGHYFISWIGGYEKYLPLNHLSANLKYELWFHINGLGGQSPEVHHTTNLTVSNENLKPQKNYSIKVRSIPNQIRYKGQWSEWSAESHWRTDAVQPELVTDLPNNTKISVILCLLIPVLLIICFIPILRLKKNTFIPTPTAFFEPLYIDCGGDFKRWVVTPGYRADLLKTEETLHIDTLIESRLVFDCDNSSQILNQVFQEDKGNDHSNPMCDAVFLGLPYAISLGPPVRAPKSPPNSLNLSKRESDMEADSACWLNSTGSLEQESGWYKNHFNNRDYCTLSDTLVFNKINVSATESWCSGSVFSDVMSDGEYQVEC